MKNKLLILLFIPFVVWGIGSNDRTINAENITTKKTDQDISIQPTGAGNVILKDYTGILTVTSGTVSTYPTIDFASIVGDITIDYASTSGIASQPDLNIVSGVADSNRILSEQNAIEVASLNAASTTYALQTDLNIVSGTADSNRVFSEQNFIDITINSSSITLNKAEIDLVSGTVITLEGASETHVYNVIASTGVQASITSGVLTIQGTAGGGGGGSEIERNQVTHGFSLLDAIYHNGTIWVKAQANSGATLAMFVVTEVIDVDNFKASKFDEVTTTHGLSVGEHFYLSDTVAGAAVSTEPASFSSPLFYTEDANTVLLEVYRPSLVP